MYILNPIDNIDKIANLKYLSRIMVRLWKRNNGRYYALWEECGKTRQHSLKTKDEGKARKRLRLFKADLLAGKVKPIRSGITTRFSTFKKEFLEYKISTTAAATYDLYAEALIKAYDCWDDILMSHITSRHIDKLISDMAGSGLAIPTVNKNYRHIKHALKKAIEWGYITRKIAFPKCLKEEKAVRYLMPDELRKVMGEVDDLEFYDYCMISAYQGFRSSEILRLELYDIDNPKGFIRITSKQKSRKERRAPIHSKTVEIINRCIARAKDNNRSRLFRFKTRQTISKKFKKAARAAGFEHIRFHDLRHTYGASLALKGQGSAQIQGLMGHSSRASSEVYTTIMPNHLVDAAESVNYGPMPLPKPKKK